MWYVLDIFGLLVLLVVVRQFLVIRRGRRFLQAITNTRATNKTEALYVDWLRENPRRTEQRDMFFQIMVSLGLSQTQCAGLVVGCIAGTWKPDGKPFGELLVMKMEQHIKLDDLGDDPRKTAKRKAAMDALTAARAMLLALDAG